MQSIPDIPFCYEERSTRVKHKYLWEERRTCDFQVVMFLSNALLDSKQKKGGNVTGSLHISEAHSSLHGLCEKVFPQFFVQFSWGPFCPTFVAFYFSVVFQPVINCHILLELAQSLALLTLPFQSLPSVTQLCFPKSYFSFANFVCTEYADSALCSQFEAGEVWEPEKIRIYDLSLGIFSKM